MVTEVQTSYYNISYDNALLLLLFTEIRINLLFVALI